MSVQKKSLKQFINREEQQESRTRWNTRETRQEHSRPGDSQKHLRRLHGAPLHLEVRVIHTYVNKATFISTSCLVWKLYFLHIPISDRTYFFLYCASSFFCRLFGVQKQCCNNTILLVCPYAGLPDSTLSSLTAGTMIFPVYPDSILCQETSRHLLMLINQN